MDRVFTALVAVRVVVAVGCASESGGRAGRAPAPGWYGDIHVGGLEADGETFVANVTTTRLTDERARSSVTLRGKMPEGMYPWFIYVGSCEDGSDGPILGRPEDYPMLEPDAEGVYTATANLEIALDPNGSYYIAIHNAEAVSLMTTIVACGELERRGEAARRYTAVSVRSTPPGAAVYFIPLGEYSADSLDSMAYRGRYEIPEGVTDTSTRQLERVYKVVFDRQGRRIVRRVQVIEGFQNNVHVVFDEDGDAVPDNRDACPNTSRGVRVDERGCPADSDGDGVRDGLDSCPNTPADAVGVDERGCQRESNGDGALGGTG
jgi:hypothetical protein